MNKKIYKSNTELALDTWVKLARAYSTIEKKALENIKSFNLTMPQFGVIDVLGHLGPLKIGEIAEKMLVSGGNMTIIIDSLEKKGIIERTFDRSDRRAIFIKLTDAGVRLFNETFPIHAEFITKLMSNLKENDQKNLAGLLKELGLKAKGK